MKIVRIIPQVFLLVVLAGCSTSPPQDVLKASPESLQHRQAQSRIYDTKDEKNILSASAAVLQDLGFTLDESEAKLGVIVASKDRETDNAVFRNSMYILGVLAGVDRPGQGLDCKQKIRVSLVTKPVVNRTNVRVTFQRQTWDLEGNLTRQETIHDNKEDLYQKFFDKLSQSIFLEAHKV